MKVLYNYVRMHVANEADGQDILQEAMLSIWRAMPTFRRESSFKTWAIGIVRRRIADHFRMVYKNEHLPLQDYQDALAAEEEFHSVITAIDVGKAMNVLNDAENEIVFLVFNARLTYSEVANILDIPQGTVKSRMSAIKSKLRGELEGG